MTGAMKQLLIPAANWLPLAMFAVAVLFMVGLTVLLLVIAKRSKWPPRR